MFLEDNPDIPNVYPVLILKFSQTVPILLAVCECSDEVGFIHPSQFAALKEEAGGSLSSSGGGASQSQNALNNEITDFWIRDHKLGISTQIVISLYKAAKNAFMDLHRQYKTSNNETLENVVMIHSRALLLLSCDFGTAWNSRFPHLLNFLFHYIFCSFSFSSLRT